MKLQKDTNIAETQFCVLDTETTGLSPVYNRIIEIAIIRVKNSEMIERFSTLLNPECSIPYTITQLTGITTLDVRKAPKFSAVIERIKDFIGDDIIIGHNVKFDMSFIAEEFKRCGYEPLENTSIDTLKLARRLFPEVKSKSLENLNHALGIAHNNAHRAMGDANATAKLLFRIIEELQESYQIEMISELVAFQSFPVSKTKLKIAKKTLSEGYAKLTDSPGVYIFKNKNGDIVYIGKAKSLRNRVKDHFASTALSKSKKIVKESVELQFHETNSELSALLTEAEMIKIHRPRFNRMLKRFGSFYFLKVNLNKEFPDVEITTQPEYDGNDYFGPYNNREICEEMLEVINKSFNLRECPDRKLSEEKLCYLSEIDRCVAPCVSKDFVTYQSELDKVYEFMGGKNQTALSVLVEKMKRFSDAQKYEEAAEIKLVIEKLLKQIQKNSLISEPINKANLLIQITENKKTDLVLFLEGCVYVKDYLLEHYNIEDLIADYFFGTKQVQEQITKSHLEKMKISLSWLMANRNKCEIFYLKDYENYEEFARIVR